MFENSHEDKHNDLLYKIRHAWDSSTVLSMSCFVRSYIASQRNRDNYRYTYAQSPCYNDEAPPVLSFQQGVRHDSIVSWTCTCTVIHNWHGCSACPVASFPCATGGDSPVDIYTCTTILIMGNLHAHVSISLCDQPESPRWPANEPILDEDSHN